MVLDPLLFALFFYTLYSVVSLCKAAVVKDVDVSSSKDRDVFFVGDFNVVKAGNPDVEHHFPLARPCSEVK